ncbi:BLUF domain-containing protein [Aquimarina agarilytica]|uniref:BLUF domain-containing protein n=1 Tax=Aquimarina agarilytica TaxID=1087449 RepID=UPI000287BA25|nr:BLUF domain-containing protein [Aquimarina agarilytica]
MNTYYSAIYISKAIIPVTDIVINDILTKSRSNNQQKGITGYLYYEDGYFMQYIEADKADTLDKLIAVLEKDRRHQIVNCFNTSHTGNKRFFDWSMGQIDKNQLINLNLEQQIINYMKWLKGLHQSIDVNSSKICSMVDLLSSHKEILQLL